MTEVPGSRELFLVPGMGWGCGERPEHIALQTLPVPKGFSHTLHSGQGLDTWVIVMGAKSPLPAHHTDKGSILISVTHCKHHPSEKTPITGVTAWITTEIPK